MLLDLLIHRVHLRVHGLSDLFAHGGGRRGQHLSLHPQILLRVVVKVFRGADVGRQHLGGGAEALESFHHAGDRLVARFVGCGGVLLRFLLRDLRDLFLVLAYLQVHLNLRVGELAVGRRRVFVVGDLLHQVHRAAFVEIALDRFFFDELLGATAEKRERGENGDSEYSTHGLFSPP